MISPYRMSLPSNQKLSIDFYMLPCCFVVYTQCDVSKSCLFFIYYHTKFHDPTLLLFLLPLQNFLDHHIVITAFGSKLGGVRVGWNLLT
jgi:hypothetical protein